jgi:hypothetical protein
MVRLGSPEHGEAHAPAAVVRYDLHLVSPLSLRNYAKAEEMQRRRFARCRVILEPCVYPALCPKRRDVHASRIHAIQTKLEQSVAHPSQGALVRCRWLTARKNHLFHQPVDFLLIAFVHEA